MIRKTNTHSTHRPQITGEEEAINFLSKKKQNKTKISFLHGIERKGVVLRCLQFEPLRDGGGKQKKMKKKKKLLFLLSDSQKSQLNHLTLIGASYLCRLKATCFVNGRESAERLTSSYT